MVAMATVVGLSATIRRTGFALVPVLLIMVMLRGRRFNISQRALLFAAAVVPFLLIVGAEQAVAPLVHAGNQSSLMGRHLYAKAALLDAPPSAPHTDPLRASVDAHLEVRFAPIRQVLARAPRNVRAVLALYYETCLQGPCADATRGLMSSEPESRQTAFLGGAGWARIARAPMPFVELTLLHLGSLWTVDRLRHPDTAAALGAFVAANRPLPFERDALGLDPGQAMELPTSSRVRYVQFAMSAIGFVTAGFALVGLVAVFARRELPPMLAAASIAALVAHGGLLFTALLAAGFSRFTLGLWPAIMIATLCGVWWLADPAYWEARLGRPFRKTNF